MSSYSDIIKNAIAEDLINRRDITTEFFIDGNQIGQGWIEARQNAVVSGINVAVAVFDEIDPALDIRVLCKDGVNVKSGDRVIEISGRASSILAAERTALNFLCHLSGIATLTSEFVAATKQWHTAILCTRKTTPGLRDMEIEAVRHGGGGVFRTNLSDSVLVKDNHLGIIGGFKALRQKLDSLRTNRPELISQILESGKVEVSNHTELSEAVDMGWKQILLDNFTPPDVHKAVEAYGKRVFLEVSGGVNITNLTDYATTEVHAISIGALTHSIKSVDFSLEVLWSLS